MRIMVAGKRFKIRKDLVVFFQRKLADETVRDYFKTIKAKDFRRYLQAVGKAAYPTRPRRMMRLAIVARGLKSSDLYDTLIQRVVQIIKLENCLGLARLAHFLDVPEVESAAVEFALTHREDVLTKTAGMKKVKPHKLTHCWRCRCKYNLWKTSETSTPCELEFILESGIGFLDDLWDGQYSRRPSGFRLGKAAVIGAGDCPEWSSAFPSGVQAKAGGPARRDVILNTLRTRTFPTTFVPKRRMLSHGFHLQYGVF
ncbi:uncharacterized protein [Branchiostoma lanceolatum]|uniref:uncharacterized protein n=1 Tax=Branchiostoma lanceolatum TaxID=7740 RepID=UPI0034549982